MKNNEKKCKSCNMNCFLNVHVYMVSGIMVINFLLDIWHGIY